MQPLRHVNQTTQKLSSDTIEQIDLAIKHLQKSESLYLAPKHLSNNKLCHHLVDENQLKGSLTHLPAIVKQHTLDAKLMYKFIRYSVLWEKLDTF